MFPDPLRKSVRSEGMVRGGREREKEEGGRARPEGDRKMTTFSEDLSLLFYL